MTQRYIKSHGYHLHEGLLISPLSGRGELGAQELQVTLTEAEPTPKAGLRLTLE